MAEGLGVKGHFLLHSEPDVGPDYMRLLKKNNNNKKNPTLIITLYALEVIGTVESNLLLQVVDRYIPNTSTGT